MRQALQLPLLTCAAPAHRAAPPSHRPRRMHRVRRRRCRPRDRRRARCRRGRAARRSTVVPMPPRAGRASAPPRPSSTRSRTSGTHARRLCLAASRAVRRHFSSALSPRAPCHCAIDRAAAHGTISSTPSSVIVSTASSARSPLGSAWTTTRRGSGAGTVRRAVDPQLETVRRDRGRPRTRRACPRPSPTSTCSPTVSRRTRAACRPSSPVSATASPSGSASTRNSGSASPALPERVAHLAEQAAALS